MRGRAGAAQALGDWAAIGTDDAPRSGSISVGRERVELLVGERHLPKLDTIVDPLVVSDLATMVWSPHGHSEAVDSLRRLAQIVLIDSQDEPDVEAALARADDLSDDTYVVDLAWLRSTPWRERVAAAFDSPRRRPDLTRDLRRDGAPPRGLAGLRAAVLRLAGLAAGLGAGRALAGARALERPRAHAPAGHQAHAAAGRA